MTRDARFIRADRFQTRWDFIDLEALLPSDHRVRIVMSFVDGLDLPALYAAIEGVGSARQLERLAERDLAYRWIAGGVPLNYHGLSDFRVAHVEVLDRLLSESVTALIGEGVVSLA